MFGDGYFVDRAIHCCRIGNVSYVNYYLPDICVHNLHSFPSTQVLTSINCIYPAFLCLAIHQKYAFGDILRGRWKMFGIAKNFLCKEID